MWWWMCTGLAGPACPASVPLPVAGYPVTSPSAGIPFTTISGPEGCDLLWWCLYLWRHPCLHDRNLLGEKLCHALQNSYLWEYRSENGSDGLRMLTRARKGKSRAVEKGYLCGLASRPSG